MENFSKALASSCSVACCPAARLCGVGGRGTLGRQLKAVAYAEQFGREALEREALRALDVALRALAHIVEFGQRAQLRIARGGAGLLGRARARP